MKKKQIQALNVLITFLALQNDNCKFGPVMDLVKELKKSIQTNGNAKNLNEFIDVMKMVNKEEADDEIFEDEDEDEDDY